MDELHFYTRTQEPYADLLKKKDWFIKKAQIIARDSSECRICGRTVSEVPLEVHHNFYVQGLDPWEYPDEALVTLCADCHRKWHESHDLRLAEKQGDTWYMVKRIPCARCHGVGYLHQYSYYMDGICFRCWGERFEGGEERIRLFTEKHGKTPQEYFDVFIPLTDEEVKRLYNEKHRSLIIPYERESYLLLASIYHKDTCQPDVDLVADDGEIFPAFLDGSMLDRVNENKIYYLNVKNLLFKECMNRNNLKYIMIKGDMIPYEEAKRIENELRAAHQAKQSH